MENSQTRAIQNYRLRLNERGLTRFEVLGRGGDRQLIRSLARRLAEDNVAASKLRAVLGQVMTKQSTVKGGILTALRKSPLLGNDLNLSRARENGRKVD
jgi:hypothetical protein